MCLSLQLLAGVYSPVSPFNILFLARDSSLWRLCCYFLLFVGWLSIVGTSFLLLLCGTSFLLLLCGACCGARSVSRAGSKNNIKRLLYSMEKYQKLTYDFLVPTLLFSNLV